jgi:hypothetical protein
VTEFAKQNQKPKFEHDVFSIFDRRVLKLRCFYCNYEPRGFEGIRGCAQEGGYCTVVENVEFHFIKTDICLKPRGPCTVTECLSVNKKTTVNRMSSVSHVVLTGKMPSCKLQQKCSRGMMWHGERAKSGLPIHYPLPITFGSSPSDSEGIVSFSSGSFFSINVIY